MKNLINLNGAQLLSKNEQQSIQGGKTCEAVVAQGCIGRPNGAGCYTGVPCNSNTLGVCSGGACVAL